MLINSRRITNDVEKGPLMIRTPFLLNCKVIISNHVTAAAFSRPVTEQLFAVQKGRRKLHYQQWKVQNPHKQLHQPKIDK